METIHLKLFAKHIAKLAGLLSAENLSATGEKYL